MFGRYGLGVDDGDEVVCHGFYECLMCVDDNFLMTMDYALCIYIFIYEASCVDIAKCNV